MDKTTLELEGRNYRIYLEGSYHEPLLGRSWFGSLFNQPGWQGFGRLSDTSRLQESFVFPFITKGELSLDSSAGFLVPVYFKELLPGPRTRAVVLQDIARDPAALIDFLATQIEAHVREWKHEQDVKERPLHQRLLPKTYFFQPLSIEVIQQSLYPAFLTNRS